MITFAFIRRSMRSSALVLSDVSSIFTWSWSDEPLSVHCHSKMSKKCFKFVIDCWNHANFKAPVVVAVAAVIPWALHRASCSASWLEDWDDGVNFSNNPIMVKVWKPQQNCSCIKVQQNIFHDWFRPHSNNELGLGSGNSTWGLATLEDSIWRLGFSCWRCIGCLGARCHDH